jgi:flavin-dependent dehydrogenase
VAMPSDESDSSTDIADVVVVGFGAAGVSAAITARELGADVLAWNEHHPKSMRNLRPRHDSNVRPRD